MTILRPIFGRGVAQRRLGAEVPEFRQKFPVLLGAPVVPKAQIWNSKQICLGPPLKYSHAQTLAEVLIIEVKPLTPPLSLSGKALAEHNKEDALKVCYLTVFSVIVVAVLSALLLFGKSFERRHSFRPFFLNCH